MGVFPIQLFLFVDSQSIKDLTIIQKRNFTYRYAARNSPLVLVCGEV